MTSLAGVFPILPTIFKPSGGLDLVGWAQNHGVAELAVPRRILNVAAIPLLGTGKTDYVSVRKLAEADEKPA